MNMRDAVLAAHNIPRAARVELTRDEALCITILYKALREAPIRNTMEGVLFPVIEKLHVAFGLGPIQ
jgi:hypothetical protein